MKYIEKKSNKRALIYSLTALVLVLVIVAYVLIDLFMVAPDNSAPGDIDVLEEIGESSYTGAPIAYEYVHTDSITNLIIDNELGKYSFKKNKSDGIYYLYYVDANGVEQRYYPEILSADSAVEYSDIYAISDDDGIGMIPRFNYLKSVISVSYFDQRIKLPEDPTQRALALERYGLDEDSRQTVSFTYEVDKKDSEGNILKDNDGNAIKEEKSRTIRVGTSTLIGNSYYYMIDGRDDYVYITSSAYFNYVLKDFTYFVASKIISTGLTKDGTLEPLLTPEFMQWKNTVNTSGNVIAGSTVIVKTQLFEPLSRDFVGNGGSGYSSSSAISYQIDLGDYIKYNNYKKIVNALTGKAVGQIEGATNVTVPSSMFELNLSENVNITYTITAIEAIVTDSFDIDTVGTAVGENTLLRVSYDYYLGGVKKNSFTMHALIDISSPYLPSEAKAALEGASVGPLDANNEITFSIDYSTQNAPSVQFSEVVSEIVTIYDQKGNQLKEAAADSIVIYKSYYKFGSDTTLDEESKMIDLSKLTSSAEDQAKKALFVGKKTDKDSFSEFVIDEETLYTEILTPFELYKFTEVESYVTKELIAAFSFVNYYDREQFHGSTLYKNDTTGVTELYSLNEQSCEAIVRVLGGLNDTVNTSLGYSGLETVALGLTTDVMIEYGLYANTVRFTLPRGIFTTKDSLALEYDEYDWYYELTFTLYISDEVDGKRYVGCDLYNVVVSVDADDFVFLDFDFAEFYAKRDLMSSNIDYVENIEIDFNMSDISGNYYLDLMHQMIYIDTNGKVYISVPEEQKADYSTWNRIQVLVTEKEAIVDSAIHKYIKDKGYTNSQASLTELYSNKDGKPYTVGYDYLGTDAFKRIYSVLLTTRYQGLLSDSEKAVMESGETIFTIKLQLKEQAEVGNDRYVYEFKRISDRKIGVHIYRESDSATKYENGVYDFYLTQYAFKNVVGSFLSVLNGKLPDASSGYIDPFDS